MGVCNSSPGRLALLALLLASAQTLQARFVVTDLTRAPVWGLANANGSVTVSGAALPAYVHELLESRELIPDPLYRFGETELAWVRDDTWTFTRQFTLDAPWAGGELVLTGVDTVADVGLNGRPVGRVANEFRAHRFELDADALAGPGPHTLSVMLQPIKTEAQREQDAYPYYVPSVAHIKSIADHKPFIRKAGADFGWDWGPALGPAGVFSSIYLLSAAGPGAGAARSPPASDSGSHLQAAHLRQLHQGNKIRLTVHAVVARPAVGADSPTAVSGAVRLEVPELGVDATKAFQWAGAASDACRAASGGPGARVECDVLLEVDVPKDKVELWWPAGHGPQKLYDAKVTWQPTAGSDGGASCSDAAVLDADQLLQGSDAAPGAPAPGFQSYYCSAAKRQIGFRTIELVTVPMAEAAKELAPAGEAAAAASNNPGESMYFRVNGVAMFLKGANLIPFHTVRTKATNELMMTVLNSALDVHMNVLRVWGGGIYQPDAFYSACDRLGLMVWQEAMFACAMYPADDKFLGEVRQEMREQVLRIGHHTSVAIWGGNNENEAAFGWFPKTINERPFYQAEYIKLFFGVVGDEITKLDPERPFIDSSPTTGPFYTGASADGKLSAPLKDQLAAKRWGSVSSYNYGDLHYYWGYTTVLDCTQPGLVPAGRMLSEFGWQSDAAWFSIKHATAPEDWDTWAPAAQYRQRWTADGNHVKTEQIRKLLGGLPAHYFKDASPERRAQLYGDWIYLRQVTQSACYDYTISQMRRAMRDPKRLSMGTLYWQLNDGASWSSFDYEGRWKVLHHALQKTYAPIQLQAALNPNDEAVAVHLAYDESGPLPVPVKIDLFVEPVSDYVNASSACNGAPVKTVIVGDGTPLTATPLWSSPVKSLLDARPGCTRGTCYLRAVASLTPGARDTPVARRRGADTLLGGGNTQEATAFFTKLQSVALPEISVRAFEFRKVAPNAVEFKVSAVGGAAVQAFWDAEPAGHFSVNAVEVLRPCAPVAVRFEAVNGAVDAAELRDSLTVWTINGALQGRQSGAYGSRAAAKRSLTAGKKANAPRPLRASG